MKLPAGTTGALVINVVNDSPADKVGLPGSDKTLKTNGSEYQLGGDVITAINGQPVEDMDALVAYLLEETHPGDVVTLKVLHPNGETETIKATLEARPIAPSSGGNNK